MKRILLSAFVTTLAIASSNSFAEENKTKTAEHKGKMFERMDANKDGFISKEEHQKKSEETFTKMDTNKDNKVSQDEAKAFFDARRAEHKGHDKEPATENKTNKTTN